MPKRLLDADAMYRSAKLAALPAWMIPEYAWLYGLADCNGSFEITLPRVLWATAYAIRPEISLDAFLEILTTFEATGLLFTWAVAGRRYGHWTASEKPGRLPPPSHRHDHYEKILAPALPAEYLSYCERFNTCTNGPLVQSPTRSGEPTSYPLVQSPTAAGASTTLGKGLGLGLGLGLGKGLGKGKSKSLHHLKEEKKSKKSPDPRHAQVREFIQASWLSANPGMKAAPWGPAEAGLLGMFLSENPSWTTEQICTCVMNRLLSEGHPQSEQPRKWLPSLATYLAGPLDRYGKLLRKEESYGEKRDRRNAEVVGKVLGPG